MTVTVVSCVYGEHYRRFVPRWAAALAALDPAPDAVIVAADSQLDITGTRVIASYCHWRYPQALYLQQAIMAATTDWVWIVDIDDVAFPDGLQGLHDVLGDVWAVGYERSDGEVFIPGAAYDLDAACPFAAGSMVRTDIFREVGGFSDVALQDWSLWRKLYRHGAAFSLSDRAHYCYMRHPRTRGATELTLDVRAEHYDEMREAELAHA
jgi:hypothetical protein